MLPDKMKKLKNHLDKLTAKHAELDEEIQKLEDNPSIDNTAIQGLKKKKLFIKDQLAELRAEFDMPEESDSNQ